MCVCVRVRGVGGHWTGLPQICLEGAFRQRQNVRSPRVPATSARAAACAEGCVVFNSCTMQGAPELEGAGGEGRERSGVLSQGSCS